MSTIPRPSPIRSTGRVWNRIRGGVVATLAVIGVSAGCGNDAVQGPGDRPSIVVSNAILGAVVTEVVGSAGTVTVLMDNGVDPHSFSPSAQDMEALSRADLVVINGLGLEAQLEPSVQRVRAKNIPIFRATDHVTIRTMDNSDEGDEHTSVHGAEDPHFWTDPRRMASVVADLGDELTDLGIDIGDRARIFAERLMNLDHRLAERVGVLSVDERVLVTGHESLGYFADRYGFRVIGTVIPGLSTSAEESARHLAELKELIRSTSVGVIFTELGTPASALSALAKETGVEVVQLTTHLLPDRDESGVVLQGGDAYEAFIDRLMGSIVEAIERTQSVSRS